MVKFEEEKNNKIAYAYGRMAFDMYYTLNVPYSQNLEAIKMPSNMEVSIMNTSSLILLPA